MPITRRMSLGLAAAALTGLVGGIAGPRTARAAGGPDSYDDGKIRIQPIQHASFVLMTPDLVIYNDPVGGGALYAGQPKPDLIMITHEHQDHYDPATLHALVQDKTKLVTNPAVHDMLPDDLKAKATAMANGDETTVDGIPISAIPAYNTTSDRLKYHPKGRDNGYILTIDDKKIYIAGDTEDIPAMRELKDIFIAFVPMNLPYTMTTAQAASAVAEFAPAYVYPYHYRGQDPKDFASRLDEAGSKTKVVFGPWYD